MTPKERHALECAGRMCVAMDWFGLAMAGRHGPDPEAAARALTDLLSARRDYDRAIMDLPNEQAEEAMTDKFYSAEEVRRGLLEALNIGEREVRAEGMLAYGRDTAIANRVLSSLVAVPPPGEVRAAEDDEYRDAVWNQAFEAGRLACVETHE